jgi:cytochrome P450
LAWDETQKQYFVVRHGAVRRVLQDRTLLRERSRAGAGTAVAGTYEAPPEDIVERKNGAQVLIFKDGEDHIRLRSLIGGAFLARVREARPVVEAIVRDAVAALPTAGAAFDLVAQYAIPIPVRVIATLLGLPQSDHAKVRAWSDDLALGFNPYRIQEEDARRWQAIREMLVYFRGRLEVARATKTSDLISDWVSLKERGAHLSEAEIVDHCIMMLTAGNLSTTDLIANAALAILRDGGLREKLRRDDGLVGAIIEESLRVDPPVTTTDRIVARAGEVADCPFSEGDVLTTSLLAANHDPEVFADPHCFDAARPARPHLAFGAGAHICLGAPLARLEGQAAIQELFARYGDLQLLDKNVHLRPVPGHRGPSRLMVRG